MSLFPESENFSSAAHQLMLKYKDKKWYQLWGATIKKSLTICTHAIYSDSGGQSADITLWNHHKYFLTVAFFYLVYSL